MQETFLLALARLGQVRDPEAVGGWLHAVLRSVCAMELRRPARRVTVAELGDVPATQHAAEQLAEVVSSAAITVIESGFVNPPDDPQHCPPAVTHVLFHYGTDQVRRSLGYFHPRPAPTRE